jgi:hypothetical protein
VLKEIQMAQTLDLRVVHGVLAGYVSIGKPAARDEVHGNRELAFAGIKVDALYVPRGLDSQGGFKQLVRHCSFRLAWLVAAFCRNQA